MREEKERNIRGERSRYSLAQGGNGIPSTSEPFMAFVNSEQIDNEQPIENDAEVGCSSIWVYSRSGYI